MKPPLLVSLALVLLLVTSPVVAANECLCNEEIPQAVMIHVVNTTLYQQENISVEIFETHKELANPLLWLVRIAVTENPFEEDVADKSSVIYLTNSAGDITPYLYKGHTYKICVGGYLTKIQIDKENFYTIVVR